MAESHNVLTLSDTNFAQEVESSSGLVIVDFWATWCGPCKAIAPIIDQIANEYAGQVKVGKVDVDSNQRTSARFGIRSIPTLMFFKDGKPVDVVVGAVPKAQIISRIQSFQS